MEENQEGLKKQSKITLGGCSFTGTITDFNVWSRPLSLEDVAEYTSGCNPYYVEKSKPEIVFWPKLNVTSQGKYVKKISLPYGIVCDLRKKLKRQKFTFLMPRRWSYDYSQRFCTQMNAEMFYPRSEQHLDELISKLGNFLHNKCTDKFWAPIVRSKSNSSQWIYDRRSNLTEEIVTFLPWRKVDEDNGVMETDCLFFNISSKEFHEESCGEGFPLCTVFAIEENRWQFDQHFTNSSFVQEC